MFYNYHDINLKVDPVLTIYLNGSTNLQNNHIDLKLEQITRMSYHQLYLQLGQQFGFDVKTSGINLRLFDDQGVEIYQEDLKFIQNNKVLYASDGDEFDPASCFSEYKLLRKLGEGGFGNVLLGQHKVTKHKVAIKIMNTNTLGNAQDIDMVFREAEVLKSLRHKNIVNIYKCYSLPNMQVVFIMEYLEGGELLEYLNEKGKQSEDEARVFIKQITEAVQYCHSQKLIHRDLKMENVILKHKDQTQIKVIDFGISGLANNFNVDKIDVGSLKYMAPECISGSNSKIGPSIDVWALGVILFALTTGYLPFKGDSVQEIKQSIQTAKYQIPVRLHLSIEYTDLLSRIFILDPLKRIKVNDILNHPWMLSQDALPDGENIQPRQNTLIQIPRESTVKFVDEIQGLKKFNQKLTKFVDYDSGAQAPPSENTISFTSRKDAYGFSSNPRFKKSQDRQPLNSKISTTNQLNQYYSRALSKNQLNDDKQSFSNHKFILNTINVQNHSVQFNKDLSQREQTKNTKITNDHIVTMKQSRQTQIKTQTLIKNFDDPMEQDNYQPKALKKGKVQFLNKILQDANVPTLKPLALRVKVSPSQSHRNRLTANHFRINSFRMD